MRVFLDIHVVGYGAIVDAGRLVSLD